MTIDLAIHDYVKQLRRAGHRPGEKLAHNILRSGEAAIGPLTELAADTALLELEPPECYAPLHALRLLGELKTPRMIAPLLRAFELTGDDAPLARRLWEVELPQILGSLGEAAAEPLWAVVDSQDYAQAQRSAAIVALTFATAAAPALRPAVIAGLRERLTRAEDTREAGYLITGLANLGASEAYQEVMARFRAGTVDLDVATAAQSRQLLLSPTGKRLDCALHPLWERYDEHGPSQAQEEQEYSY
jgi:hypothetical protein